MMKYSVCWAFFCMALLDAYLAHEAEATEAKALKWWQKTAVYQIYPKSFADTNGNGTGDIPGITGRLDYLKDLGVGAIWLTPVYPSPMVDNGYDIADYTGIDPSYGTMEDFERLVAEARKRDIRIVMDLVFNHSSNQHAWFLESKKDRTNPKADWYIWRDAKPDGSAPTNWRGIFGGSAWTWCEERGQYYLHTFAEQQPDLNWENPELRRALFDAARFWLDKGVGGFRIDAITYIKKPDEFKDGEPDGKDGMVGVHSMTANTPGILDFLREFRREVFAGRDIFTVGEANGVAPEELKDWVGEKGVFDMLFEFSHMTLSFREGEVWCYPREPLKNPPEGWKLTELKGALTASQNATRDNGWCPVFFENHDQPRCVDHFFPKGADPVKAAKAMATVLLTLRGTPFVYQGQELGLANVAWPSIEDYNDISSHGQYAFALSEGFTPEQAMGFVHLFSRDNARTPMQWNADANAGFTAAGIKPWLPVHDDYRTVNAEAEAKDPDSVLSWYRKLMRFRREHEELVRGTYEELMPESEEVFAFARVLDGSRLITVVNFSLNEVRLPEGIADGGTLLLSSLDGDRPGSGVILRPLEACVFHFSLD
ncbi:MAG: alpha-glucosidase [Synergistaceae bacterium]|nr:alpha-glucosidase [Synergistaceae bacterium]